jgi:hypothetical protein
LVDPILLVGPSAKASCGTANLDLSGCPNCRIGLLPSRANDRQTRQSAPPR